MIDLLLQGEPAQCRVAVTELDLFVHQLRAAAEELDTAVRTVGGSWHGVAADEFRSRLNGITGEAEELQRKATQLLRALDEFAVALERVRAELEGARTDALLAGLLVQGEVIQPPPTLTTDLPAAAPILGPVASPFGVDHRVEVYWRCHDRVRTARIRERYAHDDLQAAARAVLREPFLEHWLAKLGLLPSDPGGMGLWGGTAALFTAGTGADWATKVKYGQFRPLVNGRATLAADLTRWQRFRYSLRPGGWAPKFGQEVPHAQWAQAGKALGIAGAAVAGGTSAWGSWQADSDDPSISDSERAARAGTVGVSSAAGAYAGAIGGAQLGGAIGMAIFPGAGSVVGAAIGGTIGGVLGSGAGEMAGSAVAGVVGDVAGGVGKALGKLF